LLYYTILFDISIEIFFAHTSFKWTNNAKANAGVTVIIIGLKPVSLKSTRKIIFEGKISKDVGKINAYLTSGNNIFVDRRNTPLANLPSMPKGNMPYDGGHLLLSTEEKNSLLLKYPQIEPIIKRLVGSFEFINGVERWCLWISNDNLKLALSVPEIENKIENVKLLRLNSSDSGAKKLALRAHQFREVNETISQSVVVPSVSSENRQYVPIGFITSNTIVTNLAFAIYEAEAWLFALLTSRMHMVWIKAVCGNLKLGLDIHLLLATIPSLSHRFRRHRSRN
jgi:hypothetical protein